MTYRLQITIPMDDNLPENFASNTLHFEVPDTTVQCPLIEAAVNSMYQNFNTHLSSLITPSTWTYKWFNLADPEPRVPFRTTLNQGALATGTTALPPEVALCLSWKSAAVSGFPAGRLRNRIYIGPLANGAAGTDGRPTSTAVTALANSGDILLEASKAAGWDWVVFSPSQSALAEVDSFVIESGWVDNEFDTQRRRGRRSTTRTIFS